MSVATGTDWRAVDWAAATRTVELDGAKLSYVTLGSAEPAVLFVHGLGAQWRVWAQNLPVVAERRRAIAVDLPGFGQSEDGRGPISIRGYAELLDSLCELLGLDRVVLVGNSMGGFIAAELALIAPSRVAGLVLVDAVGMVPTRAELSRVLPFLWSTVLLGGRVAAAGHRIAARPGLRRAMLRLVVHDPAALPADLTQWALLAAPGPSTREAMRAAISYLTDDWGERLRAVTCPTMIMWGEDDSLTPVRHADEYASRLPGARVVRFPRAGHLPMVEQPLLFDEALLEFLDAD